MKRQDIFFSTKQKIFKNKNIEVLTTSALNGFSKGVYKSLNLAFHVGDNTECVEKNHNLLKDTLGCENIFYLTQEHGNIIINAKDLELGKIHSADGIFCDRLNTYCLIMIADCACVVIYARSFRSDARAFVILHVGRSGALNNIIGNAIKLFGNCGFNTKNSSFCAFVSPHIQSKHYEIDYKLAKNILQNPFSSKSIKTRASLKHSKRYRNIKYFFDIKRVIRTQLVENAIYNIECSKYSTFNTRSLFSHRRSILQNRTTGRFGVIARLI